jgi:hypothetical protein
MPASPSAMDGPRLARPRPLREHRIGVIVPPRSDRPCRARYRSPPRPAASVAARLGMVVEPAPAQQSSAQTAPLTPKEARRARRAAVKEFHQRLADDYPGVFAAENCAPQVALAIGIHRAIGESYRDVPTKTRHLFLHEYTRTAAYLALLQPGAARVDLDGVAVGVITDAEAERAIERLQKRRVA